MLKYYRRERIEFLRSVIFNKGDGMVNVYLRSLKSLGENDGTHFFGSPMFTKKLFKTKFLKEELFVGQINFAEIKPYDDDDVLPDEGMLYIIYDVFAHKYSLFFDEDEAVYFLDGFNKKFDNNRYDNPLKLDLETAEDEDEINENCNKMLCPVPQSVATKIDKADDYVCLFKFIPQIMDDLGRPFLMKIKECSCVLIKKKHLLKRKFGKCVTVNV